MAQPSWQTKGASPMIIRWVVIGIAVLSVGAFLFDFPQVYNRGVDYIEQRYGFALPRVHKQSPFVLGLDLKGGAHLVYEANVAGIPDVEQRDAVDGVRDVIERRVNALGVAEPIVQTNKSGDTWRIIVELAGVSNVQDAIDAIGETPVLEFKEVSEEPPRELTTEERAELAEINAQQKERAEELLDKVVNQGESFEDIASAHSEDINSRDNGGLIGFVRDAGVFKDLVAAVKGRADGYIAPRVIENDEGLNIVRLNGVDTEGEEFGYAHLLFCHNDSVQGCGEDRLKEDARSQAEAAYNAIVNAGGVRNAADMDRLNETYGDQGGGDLGYFPRGQLAPQVQDAIDELPLRTLSTPIDTEFGYHLIYVYDKRPFTQYSLSRILIAQTSETDILPQDERWASTGLSGKQLERADLVFDQQGAPQVQVQFNEEGRALFAELTQRHVGDLIAIFLDGQPISVPQVQQPIVQGTAIISGNFTPQAAKQLAQRLNAGALPVPIELVSQSTVGATLGGETLQKSIDAGLIGLLLVVLFMIAYYRLPGLISSLALVLYTLLVLAVFKIIPVTLTAAAISGLVLSLGMAIDANILIFERMKEELRAGKSLSVALEEGFSRAWFAIRASNVSSAITAVILIYLSTSIVKGFAITLLIGIAMSVFTAVTVTRYLMRWVIQHTKPSPWLYVGAKHNKE